MAQLNTYIPKGTHTEIKVQYKHKTYTFLVNNTTAKQMQAMTGDSRSWCIVPSRFGRWNLRLQVKGHSFLLKTLLGITDTKTRDLRTGLMKVVPDIQNLTPKYVPKETKNAGVRETILQQNKPIISNVVVLTPQQIRDLYYKTMSSNQDCLILQTVSLETVETKYCQKGVTIMEYK